MDAKDKTNKNLHCSSSQEFGGPTRYCKKMKYGNGGSIYPGSPAGLDHRETKSLMRKFPFVNHPTY